MADTPAARVAALAARLRARHDGPAVLVDLVHDLASVAASAVIAGGLDDQVAYVVAQMGDAAAAAEIGAILTALEQEERTGPRGG